MTDRPRAWTLESGGSLYYDPLGDGLSELRLVEWDREKVVPIIEAVLGGDFPDALHEDRAASAQAIFDALDRQEASDE